MVTKELGKERAKQFFQKHTNSASKKWEKIVAKNCEKNVFYSHEYRDQKMVKKTCETIFPETHQQCQQKLLGKKLSEKRAKKTFFIFTRIW